MKNKIYTPQNIKLSQSGKSVCFKPKESRWWHYIPLSKQEMSGESIIKLLNLNLIKIDLDDTTFKRGWVRVERYSLIKNSKPMSSNKKVIRKIVKRPMKHKKVNKSSVKKLITLKKSNDLEQDIVEYALENNLNFIKKNGDLFIENPITNRLLSFGKWVDKFVEIK
ncbi:MAG: hypothetical protein KAG14_00715 [Mycoplasmataceae bacterium]|nr:hypothetical protein [Mycoplasmataceae bacterium]